MGLLICKTLVEKMQGCIRVESIENQGTSFIVEIPTKTNKNIDSRELSQVNEMMMSSNIEQRIEQLNSSRKFIQMVYDEEYNSESERKCHRFMHNIPDLEIIQE